VFLFDVYISQKAGEKRKPQELKKMPTNQYRPSETNRSGIPQSYF
jgi:hypothetical protein